MVDQVLSKTWAQLEQINDDADAGNIGKSTVSSFSGDLDTLLSNGFFGIEAGATNNPSGTIGSLLVNVSVSGLLTQTFVTGQSPLSMHIRRFQGSWQTWEEIYHTGNTGVATFQQTVPLTGAETEIAISPTYTSRQMVFSAPSTGTVTRLQFQNANGEVGSISTLASATSYATTSDPRLKDFEAELPTDNEVNNRFDALFSCFKTFNWKADPTGDIVWGFDAHACIDAGLDMGVEGEGSRALDLGDVYDIIPAETKDVPILDEDGNDTGKVETVETKAAIELKVSPAGVDQSKAVPILLAKIEQQDRLLAELEHRLSQLEA